MKNPGYVGRTLILLKPDTIERNLTGEILKRFERKGLRIVAAEMRWPDKKLAEQHYQEHVNNKSHFKNMTEAILRGPVIAIILEGVNIIECSRQLIGQPNIHHSQPGTIRADFANDDKYNLVHGSDSSGAAKREITLWFNKSMVSPILPVIESEQNPGMPTDILFPPKKLAGKKLGAWNLPQAVDKPTASEWHHQPEAASPPFGVISPEDIEKAKLTLANLIKSEVGNNVISVSDALSMINNMGKTI